VPRLVAMSHGVDQGLDVLLDRDAADVDDHFVLGSQAQRRSEFVAIDYSVCLFGFKDTEVACSNSATLTMGYGYCPSSR
jgi:hypothetical protein